MFHTTIQNCLFPSILVSATFWNGSSEKIIAKAEKKELQLVLSEDILKEYMGVLEYAEIKNKIRDKRLVVKRSIEKIVSIAEFVEPIKK